MPARADSTDDIELGLLHDPVHLLFDRRLIWLPEISTAFSVDSIEGEGSARWTPEVADLPTGLLMRGDLDGVLARLEVLLADPADPFDRLRPIALSIYADVVTITHEVGSRQGT
jgi:hypothetical protein